MGIIVSSKVDRTEGVGAERLGFYNITFFGFGHETDLCQMYWRINAKRIDLFLN